MADGLNKAILVGNLGVDPELKYTQTSQAVLKLRLATSDSYMNKAGERQQRTEWHTVIVWGNRAEALNKILSKGRTIGVEGRIQTRSWEDKDGKKRYNTEIVASNVMLLGGRGGSPGDRPDSSMPSEGPQGNPGNDFSADSVSDDDIPF